MKSPTEKGESAIKEFLGHLLLKGAGPETVKMHVAGLKFLYGVTLDRQKVVARIPWPKVPHRTPDILSGSEMLALLKAVSSLVSALAMTTALRSGAAGQRGVPAASRGHRQQAWGHSTHPGADGPCVDSHDGEVRTRQRERKVVPHQVGLQLEATLAGPEAVCQDLGRYSHRVGLSNHRLLTVTDDVRHCAKCGGGNIHSQAFGRPATRDTRYHEWQHNDWQLQKAGPGQPKCAHDRPRCTHAE
jgi:hypothetical protein